MDVLTCGRGPSRVCAPWSRPTRCRSPRPRVTRHGASHATCCRPARPPCCRRHTMNGNAARRHSPLTRHSTVTQSHLGPTTNTSTRRRGSCASCFEYEFSIARPGVTRHATSAHLNRSGRQCRRPAARCSSAITNRSTRTNTARTPARLLYTYHRQREQKEHTLKARGLEGEVRRPPLPRKRHARRLFRAVARRGLDSRAARQCCPSGVHA